MTIVLSGLLAEIVSIERAQELNNQGMAVTVDNGRVIVQKENATGE
jgi:hypothetical protein